MRRSGRGLYPELIHRSGQAGGVTLRAKTLKRRPLWLASVRARRNRNRLSAEVIAELAALRDENRALGQRFEQRASETSMVLDAINALHSSLSIETRMQHILAAISRVTDVPHSSVYLLDKTGNWLKPAFKRSVDIPTQHGIFWKIKLDLRRDGFVTDVVKGKQPIVVFDADTEPRCNQEVVSVFHNKSVLGLPLVTCGKTIGAVFNTTFREHHLFSDDQVRLCFDLTGYAAAAIENAQLYEESQFRNEQLAALHRISLAITSCLDLPELLHSIMESAVNLLKVKAGDVHSSTTVTVIISW